MPLIIVNNSYMEVVRQEYDSKFYGIKNAAGESRFLHWLKGILNKQYGYDLIKKHMCQDGHLVDDMQQYLRTRSPKSQGPHVAIYNDHWAICGAEEDFNSGRVCLAIERDIFGEEQDHEH